VRPEAEPVRRGVVLGIVDGLHDAGAAVVRDGVLVAAANEERFTRVKLQGGMPTRSIAAVLAVAGLRPPMSPAWPSAASRRRPWARGVPPAQAWFAPSLGICFDRPWHPVDRLGDLLRYRLRLRARARTRARAASSARSRRPWSRALPRGCARSPCGSWTTTSRTRESAYRTAGPAAGSSSRATRTATAAASRSR
jgi:hypothetical protein